MKIDRTALLLSLDALCFAAGELAPFDDWSSVAEDARDDADGQPALASGTRRRLGSRRRTAAKSAARSSSSLK